MGKLMLVVLAVTLFYAFVTAATMIADIYRDEILKNVEATKKKEVLAGGVRRIASPISRLLQKYMRLQNSTQNRLKRDLARAGMDVTPEQYYADAIALGVILSLVAIPLYFAGFQLLVLVGPAMGVYVAYGEMHSAQDKLKELDEKIESVLPSFARIVQENITTTRDLPLIFKQYLKDVPDSPLANDLNILIGRMQTGYGQEAALLAFRDTLKNEACSKFVDALISMVKGVDQHRFMQQINEQIATLSEENIKREIAKRGPKLKKSKVLMLVFAGATLVAPIVLSLASSAGAVFGVS